jgi:hypothetical protein
VLRRSRKALRNGEPFPLAFLSASDVTKQASQRC